MSYVQKLKFKRNHPGFHDDISRVNKKISGLPTLL